MVAPLAAAFHGLSTTEMYINGTTVTKTGITESEPWNSVKVRHRWQQAAEMCECRPLCATQYRRLANACPDWWTTACESHERHQVNTTQDRHLFSSRAKQRRQRTRCTATRWAQYHSRIILDMIAPRQPTMCEVGDSRTMTLMANSLHMQEPIAEDRPRTAAPANMLLDGLCVELPPSSSSSLGEATQSFPESLPDSHANVRAVPLFEVRAHVRDGDSDQVEAKVCAQSDDSTTPTMDIEQCSVLQTMMPLLSRITCRPAACKQQWRIRWSIS